MHENKLITELRGLAAFMVMMFHFICVSNNFINNKIIFEFFQFGKYGVQVFFIISGYILSCSLLKVDFKYRNIPVFLYKRFLRIEPPYLVSLFLVITFIIARSIIKDIPINNLLNIKQIFFHICYLIPFSKFDWLSIVYWTLAIEFQFYIFLSMLFPMLVKFKNIALLFLIPLLIFSYTTKPTIAIGLFYWFPLFFVGLVISFIDFKKDKTSHINYSILFFVNLVILLKYELSIFIISMFVQYLLLSNKYLKSRCLYFLGKISFSLYLLHTLLGLTLLNLFTHIVCSNIARGFLLFFTILMTILASYIYNKYIEKPFQRISSKLKFN